MGLRRSRSEPAFGMELTRVEMRTGNLTVECSDLSTSQSGEIEAGNPIAVPLVPMGKRGKEYVEGYAKTLPKAGQKPASHPGSPTLQLQEQIIYFV